MTVICTELPPEVTRLASYLDSFRLPLGMDSVQKQMLYVLKDARTLGNGFSGYICKDLCKRMLVYRTDLTHTVSESYFATNSFDQY